MYRQVNVRGSRREIHPAQEVLEARVGAQEARSECLRLLAHVLRVRPVNPAWVHRTLTMIAEEDPYFARTRVMLLKDPTSVLAAGPGSNSPTSALSRPRLELQISSRWLDCVSGRK